MQCRQFHNALEPILYENVEVRHYNCLPVLRRLLANSKLAKCVHSFTFQRCIFALCAGKKGEVYLWKKIENEAGQLLMQLIPRMTSLVTFEWFGKDPVHDGVWQMLNRYPRIRNVGATWRITSHLDGSEVSARSRSTEFLPSDVRDR
jgi:hypothetical protein